MQHVGWRWQILTRREAREDARCVVIGVEEDVSHRRDGAPCARRPPRLNHVHGQIDTAAGVVLAIEPRLQSRCLDERDRHDPLGDSACLVRLEQHGDPVVRLIGRLEEPEGCHAIHHPTTFTVS
jgi:hypothetical protein